MTDGAQHLNRYNSVADCLISLKFDTEFDHMTADILQTFKVMASKVKICVADTCRNVSAVKNVIIIRCG